MCSVRFALDRLDLGGGGETESVSFIECAGDENRISVTVVDCDGGVPG
jgi:hypothetical protein